MRRDIARKIKGHGELIDAFTRGLSITARVLRQKQRQRGRKVYALHALEVECIGKGKAHKPYELGVKVSVATPLSHPKGGQFVTHVQALPGNPYDGHTLATVPPWKNSPGRPSPGPSPMPDTRGTMRRDRTRSMSPTETRRTPEIKRLFKRRAAVEPVIGHIKDGHGMGRNQLAHSTGDAINAVWPPSATTSGSCSDGVALLLRLILGGSRHPDIFNQSENPHSHGTC